MPSLPPTRRQFLSRLAALSFGGAAVVGGGIPAAFAAEETGARIGLVTDLHYADRDPAGSRHYRDTRAKLAEAIGRFREENVDCIVALGDLIDSAPSLQAEKEYLRQIAKDFGAAGTRVHFVVGNHCVSALTKAEYREIVGQDRSFYSFDLKGVHCVVLDACFRSDGEPYGRKNFDWKDANIPDAQIEWLKKDLEQAGQRALVFVHQRLDARPPLGVNNAGAVRDVLQRSGKVLAVVQGHDHQGDFKEIAGTGYCTLAAMVEGAAPANNAYAVIDLPPGGEIRIRGFRKQKSHQWRAGRTPA